MVLFIYGFLLVCNQSQFFVFDDPHVSAIRN